MKQFIAVLSIGALFVLAVITLTEESGRPATVGLSPSPEVGTERTLKPGPETLPIPSEADSRIRQRSNESNPVELGADAEPAAEHLEIPDFETKYAGYGVEELRRFSDLILGDIRRLRTSLVKDKLDRGEYRSLNSPDKIYVGGLAAIGGFIGKDEAGNDVAQTVEIQKGESEELDALNEEFVWLAVKLRALEAGGEK